MAFTFTNYAGLPTQQHPLANLIQDALSGYQQGIQTKYLKPNLEQELQKAQQYNKYYGPNIESQMALRKAQTGESGARTGLLGQQIRTAMMQNQYLPKQLQAQSEANQLKAMEAQMFNQMLQQRLSRQQGNLQQQPGMIPQQMTGYMPGQGMAPYMENERPEFPQQIQHQMQQQYGGNKFDFNQEPTLTDDDITNKKYFNIDTFTPKYKAWVDEQSKHMDRKEAAKFKLEHEQAMSDFKETSAAQNDLPKLNAALEAANRIKEIAERHPEFFGHNLLPGLYKKRANNELFGELQTRLIPLIVSAESQMSQRGNQLALKTALEKLPLPSDSPKTVNGKVKGLVDILNSQIKYTQDLAGGNIIRRGTKRYKLINGELYELERGDF